MAVPQTQAPVIEVPTTILRPHYSAARMARTGSYGVMGLRELHYFLVWHDIKV
jgi:hypothetical protein